MRERVIRIPSTLGDKDLVSFFTRWHWDLDPGDEVVVDISECEFLAPWALTLVATYALWLGEELGIDVQLRFNPNNRVGSYAVQAGLCELLHTARPADALPTRESRTTPLMQIQTSKDIPAFSSSVLSILSIEDEELEGAVRYSLVELLRNVVQHSRSSIGGLAMAQFFPNTGVVEIAVADVGIKILGGLQPRYGELNNDLSALKLSLLPHISGTFGMGMYGTMQNNAGLGLFFIKEIATKAGGGFFLGSGEDLIDLWGNADGSLGKKYIHSLRGGWPGTFAVLQLRRADIIDFDSLLTLCRELAAQARQDSTEASIDFVDEVPIHPGIVVVHVVSFDEDVEQAAVVREHVVISAIQNGKIVALDFAGIRFATQSFVHALMYRVLRDVPQSRSMLVITGATNASKEAIRAVAAYARTGKEV